jgi:glutaredoxin
MSAHTLSDVYKWVDESGRVHYGDKPSGNVQPKKLHGKITTFDAVAVAPSSDKPTSKVHKKKVTMYSTSWCGYCKKARKYFVAKGIPFVEYDIEKNPQAKRQYDAIGGSGVPVIAMGKRNMKGFSQASFDRFYGL